MQLANLIPCNVTETQARGVYFRMTGQAWNDQPRPDLHGRTWTRFSNTDDDLGGESVGGKLKNLSLQSSRMDVSVDPQSLVTYSEWTLVFQNDGFLNQEARAQIQLPPGGVVSRLTLWINGEPKEAAFGSSGTVRKAYQEVAVIQSRDPVLVTYAGIDRVLMQCFPVPIGGQMKVRIGFTSPLTPTTDGQSLVALPRFNQANFKDPDSHAVFVTGSKVIGEEFRSVGKGMQGTIAFNGDEATDLAVNIPAEASSISCLLYTSPSPRDRTRSRMPSSA